MFQFLRNFSLTIALVYAIVITNTEARGTDPRSVCGNVVSSEEVLAAESQLAVMRLSSSAASRYRAASNISIGVYFHVVSNGTLGRASEALVREQHDILNYGFRNTSIQFALKGITYTNNPTWHADSWMSNAAETAMTNALRVGGPETLNVFITSLGGPNAGTGYSYFPWTYANTTRSRDGVFINYATLPGGTYEGWNEGAILTHEAGHWVGLYHTFQGSCNDGDMVADTPAQRYESYYCPVDRDTCDGPGMDPVHNYMDYTDDYCRTEFTPGQAVRMKEQIALYRGLV